MKNPHNIPVYRPKSPPTQNFQMAARDPPKFFKIIFSDTNLELILPKSFVRRYGSDLGQTAYLKVPIGTLWQVQLSRRGRQVWLQEGWKQFSDHYSLFYGHFLLFAYEGNSTFHVCIFDCSASEINYPVREGEALFATSPTIDPKPVDVKPEVSVEILDRPPAPFWNAKEPKWEDGESEGEQKYGVGTSSRRITALEKAEALRPLNTSCIVPMCSSHVLGRVAKLTFPITFARKVFNGQESEVRLMASAPDERSWSVKCNTKIIQNRRRVDVGASSWRSFVEDNNLKVGDVCVFEHVNGSKHFKKGSHGVVVLKVVIFRAGDGHFSDGPK